MRHAITLRVNGEVWPLDIEPSDVLLKVLRGGIGVMSLRPPISAGSALFRRIPRTRPDRLSVRTSRPTGMWR